MNGLKDILFDTSGSTSACGERRWPRRPLIFSNGESMNQSLRKEGFQCLPLTVNIRLVWRPQPDTHYWASGDMAWWFSAAKEVLHHLHWFLTRPYPVFKYIISMSLIGPWRCGRWRSDSTWLSRFVHHFYSEGSFLNRLYPDEGSFLYPFMAGLDKHSMDRRDFLRFDIFLLQCWSEMTLDPEQKRSSDIVSYINEQPPEVCLRVIDRYMGGPIPSLPGGQPGGPTLIDAYPHAHLDRWYELHPDAASRHRHLFREYARHLTREMMLDFETALVLTRSCPSRCFNSFVRRRCRFLQTRLDSYIDCLVHFAQRDYDAM